ncbi:MAG: hypothetical protein M0R80_08630 [Proteobacteria bacterium]|jgi:hypothetical protein|nr:hypothetical protein [Pseudomonadota bacterium]
MERKEVSIEETVRKEIEDLGAGAYLLMLGYKVIGKRDKSTFVFQVPLEDERNFEDDQMAYLNSDFHRFDACLMSLKKIHNFLPREE